MTGSFPRIAALTAGLTIAYAVSAWTMEGIDPARLPWDLGLLALNTVPLLAIGRNPLAVVLACSVAYPLWLEAGHDGHLLQSLPALVAMYAVGAWDRPLWIRVIALIAPVWMVAVAVGWWGADPLEVGYVGVMFVVVWALGVAIAARRSYGRQLEAKTAALEEARRELADRAVAEERGRIARELHDVVAHAMSLITVRAGVGAHLAATRPDEATRALDVIERTGREGLAEMRRMLAVLRDPDPRGPRPEPQPGLADIARLATEVGEAGAQVAVTTEGPARDVPAGLGLAAYRVVQEALTNVVKHARGARTSVAIRYRPDAVEVEVRSAGRPPTGEPAPRGQGLRGQGLRGQGLRGMAERVALYDGRFEAGWTADGFRVWAYFPVEADP
jgi:signal transduction histidine kinase